MRRRRSILIAGLTLSLALVGSLLLWPSEPLPRAGGGSPMVIIEPPLPVGQFALNDQFGRTFTVERLYRQWSLSLELLEDCPSECDEAISALAAAYRRLVDERGLLNTQALLTGEGARHAPVSARRLLRLSGDAAALYRHGAEPLPLTLTFIDPLGRVRARLPPPYDSDMLVDEFSLLRERFAADCCFSDDVSEMVIIRGDGSLQAE